MMQFVSDDPALSAALRRQYLDGALTPDAFVDQALAPCRRPPAPPPGLLRDGAEYLPSSQTMTPAIAARFRLLAWDMIERSTEDPAIRWRAVTAVETLLNRVEGEAVPGRPMRALADAEVVEMYGELVRVATGVRDPYAPVKRTSNEQALAHLEPMGRAVEGIGDPRRQLEIAINLGIIGNALDFADPTRRAHLDRHGFDHAAQVRQAASLTYVAGLDAREAFFAALDAAPRGDVLFLADNAGEIVFDLPLITCWLRQGRSVTLVGKSVPCYNDMTAEDLTALARDPRVRACLGDCRMAHVRVIPSGTAMIGLDLRRATPDFVEAWQGAAMIYAKGQGMVQTLRYAALARDLFHAVQVKDPAYFHEGVALAPGDALFLHTVPANDIMPSHA